MLVVIESKDNALFKNTRKLKERKYRTKENKYITNDMIDDYKEMFKKDISAISLVEDVGSNKLTNGKNKAEVSIKGINKDYFNVEKINILQGRFINDDDIVNTRYVAVVSDKFVDKYFGGKFIYEEFSSSSCEILFSNSCLIKLFDFLISSELLYDATSAIL